VDNRAAVSRHLPRENRSWRRCVYENNFTCPYSRRRFPVVPERVRQL